MPVDPLERRFGRYAVPRLTLLLLAGQVLFFVAGAIRPEMLRHMLLYADLVKAGEIWRLVTFLFIPPQTHPIFLLFAWYLFYIMGTALENHWGHARYNLFILLGWLFTAILAFLTPGAPVANTYLAGSVFLAFAWLYPDFQLMLFFLIPVRIKWLALVTWLSYGWSFLSATNQWSVRFAILAATGNFLLFFGRDVFRRMTAANRSMTRRAAAIRDDRIPRHRCRACQITNLSHPDMEFRYCTDCKPPRCFCANHIDHHAHRTPEDVG